MSHINLHIFSKKTSSTEVTMKRESIEELSKHKHLHPHVKCKKNKMNCDHFENIFASLCCKLIFIFRLSDEISKGCGYNSTRCVTLPHVLSWALKNITKLHVFNTLYALHLI